MGIIGANPDRGWAMSAHIPALQALPQYDITAVATSRAESAQRAAARFAVPHAFTDARQLAEHPDVDLVVVTVKVPAHAELVDAALDAGKHVYCEWPLALTAEEAEILTTSARQAGVHHVVGLQARYSPAISYARTLLADGFVGRVTSANLYAARGKGATEEMPGWAAYTLDQANAAGVLEVVGGHTLDVLEHLLGGITDLSAALSVQRPRYTIAETGATVEVTSPDQVLLHATLATGAVASAHLHDAKVGDNRTRLEIAGTRGDLAIVVAGGPQAAQIQVGEVKLYGIQEPGGAWRELSIPDSYVNVPRTVPALAVRNVAQLYTQLARDIRSGTSEAPDFVAGLRLHRLLDTIRRSAETGTRQPVPR
ncbi:Gfo/Idh/MocA family protein [Hamadaea flava]|uniref:Gfo/Idh/MocA family protein n=1 Tax=Hamadaea flava TaxID=1742688 RepID=A0ABV8LZU6_9ACTN|nr:Gfo/Idh/MocA family oxidoreductase [Hamadaea flava]